jgi:hypothetical protein
MRRSASTAPGSGTSLNALLLIGSIRLFADGSIAFTGCIKPAAGLFENMDAPQVPDHQNVIARIARASEFSQPPAYLGTQSAKDRVRFPILSIREWEGLAEKKSYGFQGEDVLA